MPLIPSFFKLIFLLFFINYFLLASLFDAETPFWGEEDEEDEDDDTDEEDDYEDDEEDEEDEYEYGEEDEDEEEWEEDLPTFGLEENEEFVFNFLHSKKYFSENLIFVPQTETQKRAKNQGDYVSVLPVFAKRFFLQIPIVIFPKMLTSFH